MSVLPFKTVRTRVATSVSALAGWRESVWALDAFGLDPDQVQHHAFAVGLLSSQPHPTPGRRQPQEGLTTSTQVQLRFAHRLTLDGQVASYNAALDAEQDAIQAVLGTIDRTALHIVWDGTSRESLGEGWIIVTLNFTAVHRI